MKIYEAIIYNDEKKCFDQRISFEAEDSSDAKRIMDEKYGRDNYINLHNRNDADKPRQTSGLPAF